MPIHFNIYGPAASGKTRYAERFCSFYKCSEIIDEGQFPGPLKMVYKPHSCLLLSQQPVKSEMAEIWNIHIDVALRAIGVDPNG